MAGKEATETTTEAKGGGKKKIMMIVPLVLVLAAAGWFFFLRGGDEAAAETLPEPVAGAVVALDPITINLAGGHFLKLGLALQAVEGAGGGHGDPSGEKALDLAISQFSGKSVAELSTAEGRLKNKEELIARIKLAYAPHGEEAAEEETSSSHSAKADEEEAEEEEHHPVLTAEEAIEEAEALTVQPDIYDVYFTEFVMQ